MKKLKIQMNGRSDQFQTPPVALKILIPFLKQNKFKRIWECAWGKGSGAWFQTAWFCWKMNLPKDLNFVELE